MLKRSPTLLILGSVLCSSLLAQAPSNEEIPTIRTTTREVILDVIVRDKHHHAVADIHPDEIQIFEDGIKQKVSAFRDVQGSEQLQFEKAQAKAGPATSSENKPAGNALHELNFVSVVFGQIAPLNLEFSREAVLQFLKSGKLPNTYVTVYRLDRSLQVIQPYTADNAALVKAVNNAAKGLNRGGGLGTAAAVASSVDTNIQADVAIVGANPAASPQEGMMLQNKLLDPVGQIVMDPLWARNAAVQDASLAVGNALVTQAKLTNGLRVAESLSNGMDSFDALRELVHIQEKLPGRKVVLYLADGLTLPVGRRDVVSSVIGYANQSEVSFYTVDTRGLSVDDPLMQSLADQQRAAAESRASSASPILGHKEDNDIQLSTTSDRQLALVELAESTGGFAVTNTNQIALPMQRVMEDIRTHYELAYTPTSTNYDGRFRKIEVRVSRPHVSVQTRSGYFALPVVNGETFQPFEMAALRAINARPAPTDFPCQMALLKFRPKAAGGEYQMAFDVPISSLRVATDPNTGKGRVQFSAVALIRNGGGEVVGKISRDLTREVSNGAPAKAEDDHVVYAEALELPPGHYSVDAAVTDDIAEKSAVKHMSVFVDQGKSFGVSSLELVRGAKPLSGPRDSTDPFQTDKVRVVPLLTDSLPAGHPLNLYFVVYPAATSEIKPTLTLKVYRDGREVGTQNLAPPQLQTDGTIPVFLRLTPDPGQCDVVVTAEQGTMKSEATLSLKITPGSGASQPN